ncbi:hypothetical protein ASC59_08400 [Leifsonia sp. Root1293]|nr:hypothetical protein ASC59_08400 [Leifsonia sp. Root1293]KRA12020.1 hypothetical protein ASD61_08400 [Leifsonia sp. Root60]
MWRQIASYEDPLSSSLFYPSVYEPISYLKSLRGERWGGSTQSASELHLKEGGVVLYDLTSTYNTAGLSVFKASGPRPDVPTDWGRNYDGPSQVFTCYRMEAEFSAGAMPSVGRTTFDHCPPALVELMPADAAFASGEVFDG